MSNTNITTTTETTTVVVEENIVRIELNNIGVQGVPGANTDPTYVTVRNATGATLAKGTIVYISGANGNHVQVTPAIATSDATSARTLGWLSAAIANNASGLCMVEGYLEGINTQSFNAGDQLYLSPTVAGGFTATKPVAPNHLVYVGVVTKKSAGDGHVFVKVQNGYELGELHDVAITNPTNNQVLTYNAATDLWVNATNAPDGVTSITAVSPLTGGTITSTGSIGINQSLLSITKSQVSDFTSGTVTSASTAQQAGTAVYAVNAGTAVYSTTSGTATYSTNSGTAVYATTSGTAVTITGDITKSQVSDFTSGTVASAGTAQQSGTAVFATNSGTATYADNSGTAVFATTSGTAVFATNASTAVNVSGSAITQSQVVNLTTDLAAKANLAGGNAFTGNQTVVSSGTTDRPLIIKGFSGQTANLLEARSSADVLMTRIDRNGAVSATYWGPVGTGLTGYLEWITSTPTFYTGAAATVGMVIRGFSGQSGDLFQAQNNGSANLAVISSTGTFRTAGLITAGNVTDVLGQLSVYTTAASRIGAVIRAAASQTANTFEIQNSAGTPLSWFNAGGSLFLGGSGTLLSAATGRAAFITNDASQVPMLIRGATSQTADLLDIQNSSSVDLFSIAASGQITAKVVANAGNQNRGIMLSNTADAWQSGMYLRSDAGGNPRLSLLAPTGALGEAVSIDAAAKVGIGNIAPVAQLDVYSQSASRVGLVVRGASGQTSNLQQWQISDTTVVARVLADGQFVSSGINTSNNYARMLEANSGGTMQLTKMTAQAGNAGAGIGRIYFRDGTNAGTLKLVVRAGAAGAETTILDNIPQ